MLRPVSTSRDNIVKMEQPGSKDSRKFLTFFAGEHQCGVSTAQVREVIQYSPVMPLSHMPEFVLGITFARHEPIPVVDLNLLFGSEQQTEVYDETCFIIVLMTTDNNEKMPVCLLSDRICQTYQIFEKDVDPPPVIGKKILADYLLGMGRTSEGLWMLLNVDQLLVSYIPVVQSAMSRHDIKGVNDSELTTDLAGKRKDNSFVKERRKFLSAWANEVEFALPVGKIVQIIKNRRQEPDLEDENMPAVLSRAAVVNGEIIGLIDVRRLIGGSISSNTGISREGDAIILIHVNDQVVGVIVDKIGMIHELQAEQIQQSQFFKQVERTRVRSLGFIEAESGSFEIIDPASLLTDEELGSIDCWKKCISRLIEMHDNDDEANHSQTDGIVNELSKYSGTYLIVRAGSELIGLPSLNIQEVLSYESLISLPNMRDDVIGLMDLRGKTYPVIDLRRRLDIKEAGEVSDRCCIVCMKFDDETTGFLLDQILDISCLTTNDIECPYNSHLMISPECLPAVANHQEGLVHLVDIPNILASSEVSVKKIVSESMS